MGDIIQLPRKNPYRKLSPAEILAIKDPTDTAEAQRQRWAAGRAGGQSKAAKKRTGKAAAKSQILEILGDGQPKSIRAISESIDCRISRNTVSRYLKELEREGRIYKIHSLWSAAEVFE